MSASRERYYPIGNTPPKDLTVGCNVPDDVSFLLLGCGDVRNILYTISLLHNNNICPQNISFYLNDIRVGILCRDVLLLYIISEIDPEKEEDMKFLWAVWYDAFLSKEHSERLHKILNILVNMDFSNIDYPTKTLMKSVFVNWLKVLPVEEVMKKRYDALNDQYKYVKERFPDESIKRLLGRFTKQNPRLQSGELFDLCQKEIKDFVELGVTGINLGGKTRDEIIKCCSMNPTFFSFIDDNITWTTEDSCNPFLAFDIDSSRYDGVDKNLAALCLSQLTQWVKSYKTYTEQSNKPQYFLLLDDVLSVLSELPTEQYFDFIDTSNLSDSQGLLNILVQCQPRLNRDNGILTTEMFHFFECYTRIEELFEKCLGCSASLLPTLVGLHFAEDIDIGTEKLMLHGMFLGVHSVTLRWKVAKTPSTLNLKGSPVLTEGLKEIFSVPDKFPLDEISRVDCYLNVQFEETKRMMLNRLLTFCDDQSSEFIKQNFADILKPNTGEKSERKHQHNIVITCLTETEKCFHVKFKMDDKFCFGNFSVDYTDKNRKDNFCFKFSQGSTELSHSCQLSCAVLLSDSKLKLQREVGEVTCDLIKYLPLTSGEAILPFRPLFDDVNKEPDYEKSEQSDQLLYEVNLHRVFPRSERSLENTADMNVWNILKEILFSIFVEYNSSPSHKTMLVMKDTNTPSMILSVDYFKLIHGLPTLIVKWIDFDQETHKENKSETTHTEMMTAIFQSRDLPRIYKLQKLTKITSEYDRAFALLRKILSLNSKRMKQSCEQNVILPWKNSFLRPRYPFMPLVVYKFIADSKTTPLQNPIETLLANIAEMCPGLSRIETFRASFGMVISWYTNPPLCLDFQLVFCSSCCVSGVTCKRCTHCRSVFYCNHQCQRKDWNEHKKICRKPSS